VNRTSALFLIPAERQTYTHIMGTNGDSAATHDTTKPAQKRMLTKINTITISNGSMNFADLSLTPKLRNRYLPLAGSIKDLSS